MPRTLALVLFVVVSLGGLHPAMAETPRNLVWDDLIPDGPPMDDPFATLQPEQLYDLEILADIRQMQANGVLDKKDPMEADARDITRRMREQGLDVDALLAQYRAMVAEQAVRDREMVASLDGTLIRMPGYALPLEFSGRGVTEFLLVPYVGACIHVPPPPPNQIVHVKLGESFQPTDLYDPVWITGRITVKSATVSLFQTDGTGNVDVGYLLEATAIEPYED